MKTYLSELFSSIQGEGPYIGERHLFVRFCECHRKCIFCDTNTQQTDNIMVEMSSEEIEYLPNPISLENLLNLINKIDKNNNNKKISITGGEPLLQTRFLKKLLPSLVENKKKIYLETAGDLPKQLEAIVKWIDVASVDIKLASVTNEKNNFPLHWQFIKCLSDYNIEFFTKIIVSNDTDEMELISAAEGISKYAGKNNLFILQPMSSTERVNNIPTLKNIMKWQEKLESVLDNVRVIPQTHKIMGIL